MAQLRQDLALSPEPGCEQPRINSSSHDLDCRALLNRLIRIDSPLRQINRSHATGRNLIQNLPRSDHGPR